MMSMAQSYYDVQCEGHGFPFVTSISCVSSILPQYHPCDSNYICRECVRLKQLYPRCAQRLQVSCKDTLDDIDCRSAFGFCEDSFTGLFESELAYICAIRLHLADGTRTQR